MKLKKKNVLILIIILILITLISSLIFNNKKTNKKEIKLKIEDRVKTLEAFDSGEYYKNGWILIPGIMDEIILDFTSGDATLDYSHGWTSSRYQTDENREVIMGHNILNVSSNPMLPNDTLKDFEALMAFIYYDVAKDNLYIQYTKDGKNELYLIYAVGFYDYGYDEAESFNNKEDTENYIKEVLKNSIYDYDVKVGPNDELITLKTCTRYFGVKEKQQLFIDARKVRKNEKIYERTIKKTENYEMLSKDKEESL